MKFCRSFVLLFASSFFLVSGYAWDGALSGKVKKIDVTSGGSFGFRIFLNPSAPHCAGGPDWAYLNENDSNYKTYIATLLSARAMGSSVILFSWSENGYCHIGYISVSE